MITDLIDLKNSSMLTVQEMSGIGLTLNGTTFSSLTIDPSTMDLVFTSTAPGIWDFRWLDQGGGNWVARSRR